MARAAKILRLPFTMSNSNMATTHNVELAWGLTAARSLTRGTEEDHQTPTNSALMLRSYVSSNVFQV